MIQNTPHRRGILLIHNMQQLSTAFHAADAA
ncbi:Hypothetical protein Asd1617_06407 (plasmid) [Shigella dysenteriae 1617]|uniref:Uncharacterized protein n=1 Tax=Shigella dysenteriae 1617 TaxID=754093 RepID=A0A0A7A556_SHIDY|nr:Hypothetical protein Asd1617_06407 [Shigella dysenteriae 1617]